MTTTKPETPSRASLIRDALRSVGPRPSTPDAKPPELTATGKRRYKGPKGRALAPVDMTSRLPLFAARDSVRTWMKEGREFGLASDQTLMQAGDEARTYVSVAPPLASGYTPGRPVASGWREHADRLEQAGYVLVVAPNGMATLTSAGGRAEPEALSTFSIVSAWIAAGLAGRAWPCSWCGQEAARLLAGGVPACDEHSRALP